jgi:hypothetical protein
MKKLQICKHEKNKGKADFRNVPILMPPEEDDASIRSAQRRKRRGDLDGVDDRGPRKRGRKKKEKPKSTNPVGRPKKIRDERPHSQSSELSYLICCAFSLQQSCRHRWHRARTFMSTMHYLFWSIEICPSLPSEQIQNVLTT